MPVDARPYPVNVLLGGRRCLVVGGGRVAARKATELAECGADVTVIAEDPGEDMAALVGSHRDAVQVDCRRFRPGDVEGYWFVVTATGDPLVDSAVAADAEVHHVWVNSADDPENCSVTLPARVRHGDILVTASTAGRSPALASWLAACLDADLGGEYEVLLDILSSEREAIRARGQSTENLDWKSALDSGILELVRQGHIEAAKERLQACLSSPSA